MVYSKMEMRMKILVGFSVSADYRAFLSTARLHTAYCILHTLVQRQDKKDASHTNVQVASLDNAHRAAPFFTFLGRFKSLGSERIR